jgi:hypothetical protein
LYWPIGFAVADYAELVSWWSKVVEGTGVHLYIGQAAYRTGSASFGEAGELTAHLALNRKYPKVEGDVYFSAKDLLADRDNSISRLVTDSYSAPALTQANAPDDNQSWPAPVLTQAKAHAGNGGTTGSVQLTWQAPQNQRSAGSTVRKYVVYRFDGATVPDRCDFADASHLVAVVSEQTLTDHPTTACQHTYLVTAVDRLGREAILRPAASGS